MIFKRVELIPQNKDVWLDVYAAGKVGKYVRDAMLVIPGGGYGCVCNDREGEPIAQAFMPHGFSAFVLNYSVGEKARFPQPLIEASLAMKHIKDNAEEYGVNPERVFVTGFSAGGHLCAALGTLWHLEEVCEAAGIPVGYNKPKAMIPVYPVISSEMPTHQGSFHNILGPNPSEELKARYSLEKCVDSRTVPAFLVHTANDGVVHVSNSLKFANALSANGIPFELHIFADAPHGMALCNELTACQPNGAQSKMINPHNARWVELAAEWCKSLD